MWICIDMRVHGEYKSVYISLCNSASIISLGFMCLWPCVWVNIFLSPSLQLDLVLECAHLLDADDPHKIPSRDDILGKLIISFNDVVTITAKDADTKHGEIGGLHWKLPEPVISLV